MHGLSLIGKTSKAWMYLGFVLFLGYSLEARIKAKLYYLICVFVSLLKFFQFLLTGMIYFA